MSEEPAQHEVGRQPRPGSITSPNMKATKSTKSKVEQAPEMRSPSTKSDQIAKELFMRIENIPIQETFDQLKAKLEHLTYPPEIGPTKENVLGLSLARRTKDRACATVVFRSRPTNLESLKGFEYHDHFYCITPLYDATQSDSRDVDVIAIAGLGAHPLATYKAPKSQKIWLRDFLPKDLPQSRILVYGQDTTVESSDSKQSLSELGRNFLQDVVNFRKETGTNKRPIICLGQSLGGLVLKEALSLAVEKMPQNQAYHDFCHSRAAFFFFGVPNIGLNMLPLLEMAEGGANENLIREFLVDKYSVVPSNLTKLCTDFQSCRDRLKFGLISIYELLMSKEPIKLPNGEWKREGDKGFTVTEHSARLIGRSLDNDADISLNRDHSGLAKFEDREGEYGRVGDQLRIWSSKPVQNIEELKKLYPIDDIFDRISDPVPGTMDWVRQQQQIQDWLNNPARSSFLWIQGASAQGKSVLCKYLVSTLKDTFGASASKASTTRVIYFFYSSQLPESFKEAANILKALIVQMLSSPYMFIHLKNHLFGDASEFHNAQLPTLWKIFSDMAKDDHFQVTYCLIDAVEKIEKPEAQSLLKKIRTLFSNRETNSKDPVFKFLLVSDFKEYIWPCLQIGAIAQVHVTAKNIRKVIDSQVDSLFESRSDEFKFMIKDRLHCNVGHTFPNLAPVIDKISEVTLFNDHKIVDIITKSLVDYRVLYKQLAERMCEDDDKARLLLWVLYSRRPLHVKELEIALAIRPETGCVKVADVKTYRIDLTALSILGSAGSLFKVFEDKVYFINDLVKEVLLNEASGLQQIHKLGDEFYLARSCVRYLGFNDFRIQSFRPLVPDPSEVCLLQDGIALYDYAATNWYYHIHEVADARQILKDLSKILHKESASTYNWLRQNDHNPFVIYVNAGRVLEDIANINGWLWTLLHDGTFSEAPRLPYIEEVRRRKEDRLRQEALSSAISYEDDEDDRGYYDE